jgi:hypothetical protein
MQYLIAERSWVWIMIELLLQFQATGGLGEAWYRYRRASPFFCDPHPEYGCLAQSPHPTFKQGPIKKNHSSKPLEKGAKEPSVVDEIISKYSIGLRLWKANIFNERKLSSVKSRLLSFQPRP